MEVEDFEDELDAVLDLDALEREMMREADRDGDGSIDFFEFTELLTGVDFNLHPGMCDRCQNPRRERRCFLRKKHDVRCGPPADIEISTLPHWSFFVL